MSNSIVYEELKQKTTACNRCNLRSGCLGVVFGEGSLTSPVMFIGEGPGAAEDEQGRPFVGRAGQVLDSLLIEAGFRREDVYITNIVKCRPPGNRTPTYDEMMFCLPALTAQIEVLHPRVLVLLGAAATQALLDRRAKITKVRGQWFEKDGLLLMPTLHPAYLLRSPSKRQLALTDLLAVQEACKGFGG